MRPSSAPSSVARSSAWSGSIASRGSGSSTAACSGGMYVSPAAQGRGIGRALLRGLLAHAANEVEQVHLVVVSDNEPARRLYESEGFSAYGREPHALKQGEGYLDEILM